MAKSRLGKGLGALFPTIPEEKAPVESVEAAAGNGKTSKSAAPVKSPRSSAKQNNAPLKKGSPGNSRAAAQEATKVGSDARSPIPDWSEIAHPSDMFFSNTRSVASAEQEAKNVSRETSMSTSASDSQLQQVNGAYLDELQVASITPNEHQPRTVFEEEELQELSDSIKEVGVLQPIVVRKKKRGSDYELIMGERRLRASKLAGKETIPAIVRTTDDTNMLRDALLENLHRVQLNPLEEAAAYEQMIEEFGLTQAQLSKSVSKSRPQIANTLRLLQLPGSVQKRVASGVLSAGHARALLSLESEQQMLDLAKRIVAEGLSVRSTEEIVALQKGSGPAKTARKRKSASYWTSSPLPQQLGDHFDTLVNIRGSEKKGKIEISYSSPEDLQRIADLLVGESAGTSKASDGWV